MKEMIWRNIDAVWFEIELFKVKDPSNPFEDMDALEAAINSEYHRENEVFTVDSSREAVFLAETLLQRDDDYNYAVIFLCRYNEDPGVSEGTNDKGIVDERILIGDLASERNGEEE